MDYQGFIATVREQARVSDDEAERVACATLQTLSERITAGEAEDIAQRLPAELRGCVQPTSRPQVFAIDEFVHRLAHRAGVDEPSAERDARAVFAALWSAVGPDEFADMRAQLPKDFYPLLDEAVSAAPDGHARQQMSLDDFLEKVRRRADGLDRDGAMRAAESVLEALAMRITAGQVDDLAEQLPRELRPATERGRARSGGKAIPLPLDGFLDEIAASAGVERARAREYAGAVFATLHEAVGEKEWNDTWAQLPDDYRKLLRAADQPHAST